MALRAQVVFYIFSAGRKNYPNKKDRNRGIIIMEEKRDLKKLQSWSGSKLNTLISDSITDMFSKILDYAEIAIDQKERYKIFRSKVLKIGNDAIRAVTSEVGSSYLVEYTRIGQDEIRIKRD